MLYNNEKKVWEPAEGIRGMSYVQVYHHEGNNTYRIVGRCMTDHNVVSIPSGLLIFLQSGYKCETVHYRISESGVSGFQKGSGRKLNPFLTGVLPFTSKIIWY